ncbi:hypothetical protein HZ994_17405 [Akkermansiaceae bacterium]|nr:hypothetical protein HZ994_17405 [Akkermansiaceae bacterium]
MKILFAITAAFTLVSCNTSIGIWRDTKAGFNWTKERIQGSGGGGQDYEYGAPVY